MSLAVLYLVLATIPVDEVPGSDILRLFDQHYFNVDYAHDQHKSYIYHLFRPRHLETTRKYPLIVWLHGYGNIEFEEIGSGHLKHTGAIFSSADQAKEFAFYFLVVQCPPDQRGFFHSSDSRTGAPEPGDVTAKLIKELIAKESIDAKRVTLIGISGAAADCLEMGTRNPDMFAGMVLLGSPEYKLTQGSSLTRTPIWAFHATEDDMIPSDGIAKTIDTLQKSGGNAQLTMIEANYHNCWAVAFRDHALLNWLLSQKRDSRFCRAPGVDSWTWQQWVLQVVLPLVVVIAVLNELKRQKKVSTTTQSLAATFAVPPQVAPPFPELPSSHASVKS